MKRRMKPRGRQGKMLSYRKPTYGAGLRLAQIVHELQERPLGWSVDGIGEELGIHPKTVGRYVRALTKDLVGKDGEPMVVLEEKWGKSFLRLASPGSDALDLTSSQIVSLYAARALLRFVRGSPLYAPLDEAFLKSFEKLSASDKRKLTGLEKKIHYVPDGPKDYSRHADLLQRILLAVFHQNKLRVVYRSPYGSGREWDGIYSPYTLMMYKRGLYLIGHSEKHGEVRYLAIERLLKADLTDQPFNLPPGYTPTQYTDGCFGLFSGVPVDVSIRFDKWTEPLIRGRLWHPTQKIEKLKSGHLRLTMRVRGTDEILPWVMTFGPAATVEAPDALRQNVAGWASQVLTHYRAKGGYG